MTTKKTSPAGTTAGTTAAIHFENQTTDVVYITVPSNKCIEGALTDLDKYNLDANQSVEKNIETSDNIKCWASQSSFAINASTPSINGTIGFELGTGLYNTNITPSNSPQNFAGFIAANEIGTSGVNFDFFLYTGPGTLNVMANNIISANIAALIKYVQGQTVTFQGMGFHFSSFTGFDTLSCSYISVYQPAGSQILNVTAILTTGQLGINGLVTLGKYLGTTAIVNTTNLSLLVDGTFDLSRNLANLNTLKCSFDNCSLDGSIFSASPILTAIKDAALASPRALEGLLNDTYNSNIVTGINNLLKNL